MKAYRLRDAFDYFLDIEEHLAEQFRGDLQAAIAHIQRHPGTGSPRYSHLWARGARASKLRFWLLSQFPYAIFYVERDTWIDIARVLHQAADIPQHLKNQTS
jgi:toxin ParE1/3/4